jgi:hypothetical protein
LAIVQPNAVEITSAVLDGDLTITGTGLFSEIPGTTTIVNLIGPGVSPAGEKLISQKQILAAGGSISPTEVVVPAALVAGLVVGDTVFVSANGITNDDSAAVAGP